MQEQIKRKNAIRITGVEVVVAVAVVVAAAAMAVVDAVVVGVDIRGIGKTLNPDRTGVGCRGQGRCSNMREQR